MTRSAAPTGFDRALTIGIVGGMSPESTVTYYQHIVRRHHSAFGDHSYPRIVICSVSFQKYIDWQHRGDWDRIAVELEREFQSAAGAGAELAVLATNTMHKVLPAIRSPIPVLSIMEAVADFATNAGIKTVGLTGTRFTMSDRFYAEGLEARGLKVIVPDAEQQERIHRIIYDELIKGDVRDSSVEDFGAIGRALLSRGAEAIVLGCTELELLTRNRGLGIRTIDSTLVHAEAAWERAVGVSELRTQNSELFCDEV
ncbi:MAG TPA: amino acid racemase [Blastocatellia bacterium]|nr:amino acid racemase [Blastocatellia bacterium]